MRYEEASMMYPRSWLAVSRILGFVVGFLGGDINRLVVFSGILKIISCCASPSS